MQSYFLCFVANVPRKIMFLDESEEWSSQFITFQFKQLERRSLKNQGFNGIRTRDLRDTDVMLYQLSYEATHHFTAREDMNSINWPRSHCVAS